MSERTIYYRDQAEQCRWHAERMADAATKAELLKLAREYIERAALLETKVKVSPPELAILLTNHWAIIPGGANSIAATIRLNRWTGAIDVCSINAKSPTGSNAAGHQLTCDVQ